MRYCIVAIISYLSQFIISCNFQESIPSENRTTDVLIDTDLGGDPDDIQSLYRLIHYSDILKVKGIISTPCNQIQNHPWDTIPQVDLIRYWIRRIDPDHLRRAGYPEIMAEEDLLKVVKAGSPEPGLPSAGKSTEGSAYISSLASDYSPDRPLWVLVWGSLTSLAQALHDDPGIAPNIRIYYIGSSNTLHDSLSRNYLYIFMETVFPELWWIENGILPKGRHETFRGVYQGGDQEGEWGNKEFVNRHIRGHGSTRQGYFREKCGDVFPLATSPKGSLKEGDSPSLLFLISPVLVGIGNIDDPTVESWGGRFRQPDPVRFPNYYTDLNLSPEECQATINKWRKAFLSDWRDRWDRYEPMD